MAERVPTRTRRFAVPERLTAPAEAWLAGTGEIAPARLSSTVMLVRDAMDPMDGMDGMDPVGPMDGGGVGVEVFTIQRAATMPFAPLMTAFPGGGVDERDADHDLPWAGPAPRRWAQLVGRDEDLARQLVVAAAREVFEECGVLLAGRGDDDVVADLTAAQWDAERDRLLSREQSFAELLIRRGLVLRTDLLTVRAHWITPEFAPRRYDTLFFAARPPAGQTPDGRCSETILAEWGRPVDRLAAAERQDLLLMPPTRIMLEDLAAAPHAAAVMTPGPPPVTVLLTLVREASGHLMLHSRVPVAQESR